MSRVVVITGGSSGIGLAAADAFRARGCTVYELSRREAVHDNGVVHIPADVTDEAAVHSALSRIAREAGRIDLLVCNAGFGISGAAEFTENSDARRLMEVNLFGTVNAVRAALPIMRRQRGGRILCISSIAAIVPIPFQAWYSVSKASVSAYVGALRGEVRPFGIQVSAILPGDISTGFTDSREKSPVGDDVYGGRIARSVATMEHDERTGMSPVRAAEAIVRISEKPTLKPEYAIGLPYRAVTLLRRILPGRLVGWIVEKIYAK